MNLRIEINELEAKKILLEYIQNKLNNEKLEVRDLKIECKSKHNFKSEWENASFRVIYEEF